MFQDENTLGEDQLRVTAYPLPTGRVIDLPKAKSSFVPGKEAPLKLHVVFGYVGWLGGSVFEERPVNCSHLE